jgi:hypothetical protein
MLVTRLDAYLSGQPTKGSGPALRGRTHDHLRGLAEARKKKERKKTANPSPRKRRIRKRTPKTFLVNYCS